VYIVSADDFAGIGKGKVHPLAMKVQRSYMKQVVIYLPGVMQNQNNKDYQ